MDIRIFLQTVWHYIIDVVPVLAIGFFISGLIHEFMPQDFVNRYLAKKNLASIFWATIIGVFLPVCCIGSLPVAISFRRRGAQLGPILAFLVATPATSVTALLLTYRLLGVTFTVYIFFAAVVLGVIIGVLGNMLKFSAPETNKAEKEHCSSCGEKAEQPHIHKLIDRIKAVFVYSFWTMPRDIGKEILIGLLLAALIVSVAPVNSLISLYLGGAFAYGFALVFGLFMYLCSTGSVPLVHAFLTAGMNPGASMLLLLAGPITSFGTLLVVRKQFGNKILAFYVTSIAVLALILGYGFSLIY
ncbi:permease [Candidatus Margulisiibacteriota bacterium]